MNRRRWHKPYYHNRSTPPVFDSRGLYPLVGGEMWGENYILNILIRNGMKSRRAVERYRAVRAIRGDFCRRASALTGIDRIEWDMSPLSGLVLGSFFAAYEWQLLLANVIEGRAVLGRKGYFK